MRPGSLTVVPSPPPTPPHPVKLDPSTFDTATLHAETRRTDPSTGDIHLVRLRLVLAPEGKRFDFSQRGISKMWQVPRWLPQSMSRRDGINGQCRDGYHILGHRDYSSLYALPHQLVPSILHSPQHPPPSEPRLPSQPTRWCSQLTPGSRSRPSHAACVYHHHRSNAPAHHHCA